MESDHFETCLIEFGEHGEIVGRECGNSGKIVRRKWKRKGEKLGKWKWPS